MFPSHYFGLFPVFPLDHRAFVAMSFDARFDRRWADVLSPAIADVLVGGVRLGPHRVDMTRAGNSILTEILDNLARCRVIVADLSATDELNGRAVRNQNVFYEVGLAHAVRLAEEVILFRSDKLDLAFDISNVRVHTYDPDRDAAAARKMVTTTVVDSLRELDLRRSLALRQASERLDAMSWQLLMEVQPPNRLSPPKRRTMRDVLAAGIRDDAIARLLDLGAIRSQFLHVTPDLLQNSATMDADLISYEVTPFGSALFDYIVHEMGMTAPELAPHLVKLAEAHPQDHDGSV